MTNWSGANLNNGAAVGPQGEGRESPSTFPKYPACKDSGVEWLGDVPGHWNISPLKFSASCNDTVLPDSTDGDYEIEYVEISDVNEISGITGSTSYKFADAPSRARRMLQDGDVLVSTVRTYLRAIAPVVAPPENLIASTGFAVVRPRKGILDGAFLGYMLRAEWWISEVIARSVGVSYPAINASDLIGLSVPVPAWHEQTQIARFLDHETARIDALIEEQQRLIELLKEKRQAVISHAVTKGLDPTVPMKDSGVEWLGEVPARWSLPKLGHLARVMNGSTPSRDNLDYWSDGDIPWVASGSLNDYRIDLASEFITSKALKECSVEIIPSGSVLVGLVGQGKTRGLAALLNIEATINQNVCAVVPDKKKLLSGFLHLYLHCIYEPLRDFGRGANQAALNCELVSALRIPLPTLGEQHQIVQYVEGKLSEFDDLEDYAQRSIVFMQERRSALISAAVTGKIDVSGWHPPAHAQAPELEDVEAD